MLLHVLLAFTATTATPVTRANAAEPAATAKASAKAKPDVDPLTVIQLIQKQPRIYSMDGPDKLRIRLPMPEAPDRFAAAKGLLTTLKAG